MRKIGVFTGTFDPFHIAHLEACLVAKAACDLETITVFVERKPHRKQRVTAYSKRVEMIDLATQAYPSIRLIDIEADNLTTGNVLPVLENQFDHAEYWYIVGSDMIQHLKDWDNIDALLESFKLCVILRSNEHEKAVVKDLVKLRKRFSHLQYVVLPEVWSEISSSRVRQEIADNAYSQHVHRNVLKYILKENIY